MTIKIYSRDLLAKDKPRIQFPPNLQLREHVREIGKVQGGHRIYEFVGTDSFGPEWTTRQRYEVDAGRDEEPLLYAPLYDIVSDASLPKNVDVETMGPGGVIFEEVFEGGEVKFSGVTAGEYTVPIRHWATGLEYSKDLVIFNSLWNIAIFERAMGIAHNALLNHLHLSPITTYTYAAANQTAANTDGASVAENYMLTLQDAVTAAKADTTNPRRGPYTLLIASANMFTMEMALRRVPQTGLELQSSAIDTIRNIIVYDGWSGVRGAKTVTYTGVTANKAYLISQQYRGQDFRSFEKQALQNEGMETDNSRFLTQSIWDSYYGVYANPLRSVEEISLPTTA
jgi:hypothetical protein